MPDLPTTSTTNITDNTIVDTPALRHDEEIAEATLRLQTLLLINGIDIGLTGETRDGRDSIPGRMTILGAVGLIEHLEAEIGRLITEREAELAEQIHKKQEQDKIVTWQGGDDDVVREVPR